MEFARSHFLLHYQHIVHWSIGPLVYWSIGPLVHWSIGPLIHWSIGPLVHCSIGPLVHWLNFCRSVPPEFLQSFFGLSGVIGSAKWAPIYSIHISYCRILPLHRACLGNCLKPWGSKCCQHCKSRNLPLPLRHWGPRKPVGSPHLISLQPLCQSRKSPAL